MRRIIHTLALLAALLPGAAAFAQGGDATASWQADCEKAGGDTLRIVFTGTIADGWHLYPTANADNGIAVTFGPSEGVRFTSDLRERTEPTDFKGEKVFFGEVRLERDFLLTAPGATLQGEVTWSGCNDTFCGFPESWEFSLPAGETAAGEAHATVIPDPEEAGGGGSGIPWALILEAILWGLAMLLTPCVFPMVPMTISFFLKQSSSAAAGRFKAFMYGLFIVLLYTVPISVIIGITYLAGGETVTADIFNWLSTHWLPNLLFFVIFMAFAASFFGAFEIELPASLANKSDAQAERGGLAGVFFMALTLVLVSFSCTGPIVGSVLIKSTQGEFWTPMVTMLAFSVAFALPFTLLALFPSLLKKFKGADWIASVKIVLGFVELALGLKFLSVADQTYHWGILDREVYLALWIVIFSLLGLYLLGKIRFKNDAPERPMSVFRLTLVILVFSFVMYLIPGMWGAPLKALPGYLPPLETQDFVLGGSSAPAAEGAATAAPTGRSPLAERFGLQLPHGLQGYFSLEEGMAAAQAEGKPIFLDITGHGCVNCREMESRVWSDPQVLDLLRNRFVVVALYTDDKSKLEKDEWVTTPAGKVLKDFGRVNAFIARERFGVAAQPNYILLSPDGTPLTQPRGYNLSIDGFLEFLRSVL